MGASAGVFERLANAALYFTIRGYRISNTVSREQALAEEEDAEVV